MTPRSRRVLGWLNSNHPEVEVSCITIAPAGVNARYGIPSVPMAWRSPDESDKGLARTFRRLLGTVARHRPQLRAGRLGGRGHRSRHGCPRGDASRSALGFTFRAVPHGRRVSAARSALCASRRRSGMRGESHNETAVRRQRPPGRRTSVTATIGPQLRWRRAGAREPEAVAPDLAFAHPASTLANPEPGRIVVGVMAYYGKEDDPTRGADIRRTYVSTLAEALAQLVKAGDQVVLVPGDRVDVDVARDVRAAILSSDPALPVDAVSVRDFDDFTELTEEMAHAEVVIASRFHNLICALRLARPTVSVGYAVKNRNLMRALGVDGFCQDIMLLDSNQLLGQVRAARENSGALTARIRQGTLEWAEEVERLLERVATETLGLPARGSLGPDLQDEMDAWQSA